MHTAITKAMQSSEQTARLPIIATNYQNEEKNKKFKTENDDLAGYGFVYLLLFKHTTIFPQFLFLFLVPSNGKTKQSSYKVHKIPYICSISGASNSTMKQTLTNTHNSSEMLRIDFRPDWHLYRIESKEIHKLSLIRSIFVKK